MMTKANQPRLDRRAAIRVLLAERGDLLVVTGLGSTTYDAASVADDERNFYLWGAMGGAAMVGLGLAIARPDRPVLVVTGDGDTLMGLGALATVAVAAPPNLAIAVFDNGHYAETGMQPSHTFAAVSLTGVARSCGIEAVFDIADESGAHRVRPPDAAKGAHPVRSRRDPRRRAAARAAAARRGAAEEPVPPGKRGGVGRWTAPRSSIGAALPAHALPSALSRRKTNVASGGKSSASEAGWSCNGAGSAVASWPLAKSEPP